MIREQSVFRKNLKWDEVSAEVRSRAAAAKTEREKALAIRDVFARMNDVHSSLQFQGQSYGHYEAMDEAERQKLLPLLERERGQTGKPATKLLPDRYAYILVPTIFAATPEAVQQAARELHQTVVELAKRAPAGWIVDLRLNGGGNLYPMLLGLRHLLGEGVVGGTVDADGRTVNEWVLKADALYWRDRTGERLFAQLGLPVQAPDATAAVIVLVGPLTRSSGQGLALAFQGRPHCRLLGEPTARGYTTVTAPFNPSPDVFLSLAVGFMTDRTGKPCQSQVLPEETAVGGDAFDDLLQDAKVSAAIARLRQPF